MKRTLIPVLCALLSSLAGCGDTQAEDTSNEGGSPNANDGGNDPNTTTNTGGDTFDAMCEIVSGAGTLCISYSGVPNSNAVPLEEGCATSYQGAYTAGTTCSHSATAGTCVLNGDETAGATSAIINFYAPFEAFSAEYDLCGSGTFSAN